jgi:transposase
MEAWSLAPWLYAGLARAGLPIICIEARHAHAVLDATRANKTDKNDAKGIAEVMRAGIYKTVHIKTPASQQARALITVRKLLRSKARDVENGIRAALLVFGLKLNSGARSTYERRVRRLMGRDSFLKGLIEPLLSVRKRVLDEMDAFEDRLKVMAAEDPVCRRLMTAPAVGAVTALTFRAAVDEPGRFVRSRDVAAHFGLTPKANQSGEMDRHGRISKRGDSSVRVALFMAAKYQLRRAAKPSSLKTWGEAVAARRGRMKALVAIARRLAVTLHRMWVTETDFRWTTETT